MISKIMNAQNIDEMQNGSRKKRPDRKEIHEKKKMSANKNKTFLKE